MDQTRPIGDAHPFVAVKALADASGFDVLKIVNVYEGALIRLYTSSPDIVFRLKGDPGSAMDRQRFDYHKHMTVDDANPAEMLEYIKSEIATAVSQTKKPFAAKSAPRNSPSRNRRET
jgi:hypothetical protein